MSQAGRGILKIGVDARPLSVATTGIGRYTEAIIGRLLKSGHKWFLYSDAPLPKSYYGISNVVVRAGARGHKALGSVFAQTFFPCWAKCDSIDVFWSPRHHLPLLMPPPIKKVVTVHDVVWARFPETMSVFGRYLERALMPSSVRLAHAVIAVSQFTKNELEKLIPESIGKITVIPEAPFLEGTSTLKDGKYFLFVGTLEPRKNLARLLKAYRAYLDIVSVESLPLYICGGAGWGLPQISEIIRELGLEKNVRVLGYVPDTELSALYLNSRALLMPSIYEGFGLPIVEAFSQNTPVLTSNTGAMREVAGAGGVLVDPFCIQDMAAGLVQLHRNLMLVRNLQQQAKQRRRRFCWDQAAKDTLEILERVSYIE
ncbi:glycosyltransferase family 4 protein [Microbulbifer sp. TRSA005]|uniref:glycosyltransferase family 4 protein n=1 Tax=unclassified Microbulbifer TaxID=2619833 RepID=UPI00403A6C06